MTDTHKITIKPMRPKDPLRKYGYRWVYVCDTCGVGEGAVTRNLAKMLAERHTKKAEKP